MNPIQIYQSINLGLFKKILIQLNTILTPDEAHLFYPSSPWMDGWPPSYARFNYRSFIHWLFVL